MPWKAVDVPQLRAELVHLVRVLGVPVAEAARRFGVSRDTAHRWLRRFDADPAAPLEDRSRRPLAQPARTGEHVERLILELRDRYPFWGARKIHALLAKEHPGLPSARTVHAVLDRHGRVHRPRTYGPAPTRFERQHPNALWQIDHKAVGEVQRRRYEQLTVLDDHSRFLIAIPLCPDRSLAAAWERLWRVFGQFGLPEAVLSDNAFGSNWSAPRTLSWFDARLIRLGIRPIHGRPYHPQTQGKVERLHGTMQREFFPHARRQRLEWFLSDAERWRCLYNATRPHEALGDAPPIARWVPSARSRPSTLPEVHYPSGSVLRKVSTVGDIRWRTYRLLAGRGLVGSWVRVLERDSDLVLYFADHPIRTISLADLRPGTML